MLLWVTAWLAATRKPSAGSKAYGSFSNGTQPFQSYEVDHPGAGQ